MKFGRSSIFIVLGCALFSCSDKDDSDVAKAVDYEAGVYQWLVKEQLPNGLLESTTGSNFVSLYDNSLAAIAFTAKGDYAKAEKIFDVFTFLLSSEFNQGTGGFYQFRDRMGSPLSGSGRWLGDNAWLLIALNNYKAKTGSGKYNNLALILENWIRQLQDIDGSVWGGYDPITGVKTGKVTENMIDAFNAVPGYDQFHKNLLDYFNNERWDSQNKSLICAPGSYYMYALDNFSWGYCALEHFPNTSLGFADQLFLATHKSEATSKQIVGYCIDIDRDNVFFEGTGQMVVTFHKAGQTEKALYYLKEIEKGTILIPNGTIGIPYATNIGSGYGPDLLWNGADKNPCVSSAAWYVFGKMNHDPLAAGYTKNIPAVDKFWLK